MTATKRLSCLLLLGALVPAFVACGDSSDGRTQADSAAATQSSGGRAASQQGSSPPSEQVARLVPAVTQLDVWTARLRSQWGGAPTARWSAVKEADARYRARLVLQGPDASDRIAGTWLVTLPLDRKPTADEIEGDPSDDIRPIDAGARRLTALPPASRTERSVSVVTQLEPSGGDALHVPFKGMGTDGPEIRGGVLDEASLRGVLLARGAKDDDTVSLGQPGIRITDGEQAVERDELLRRAESGSPTLVRITWRDVPADATRAQLLERRPATVTVIGAS